MQLAVLADIHGNLPALEAVLAELERLQPDQVVLNGDLINAVPFSTEVIDRVSAEAWAVVRGNHEFYYLDHGTERAAASRNDPERWGQLHWLIERITPAQGMYLAMLPDDCTFYLPGTQPIRVTHGLPGRNRVGLFRAQPDEAIAAEIEVVHERTFVTAHTHVQIDRHVRVVKDMSGALSVNPHGDIHRNEISNGIRHWHVVNPGSVGLPLNARATAQFAILESVPESEEPGGWRVTHYEVPYDRRPALEAFHTTGMLEAGGVISLLFYWELVSAEPEIIHFYRWAFENGHDPDRENIRDIFTRYMDATARDHYIRALDPLNGNA